MVFDFLAPENPDFYELSFRIIRLQTASGAMETLITNLDPECFPLQTLRLLYSRRYPPFFDITSSAKIYKIASALTLPSNASVLVAFFACCSIKYISEKEDGP